MFRGLSSENLIDADTSAGLEDVSPLIVSGLWEAGTPQMLEWNLLPVQINLDEYIFILTVNPLWGAVGFSSLSPNHVR